MICSVSYNVYYYFLFKFVTYECIQYMAVLYYPVAGPFKCGNMHAPKKPRSICLQECIIFVVVVSYYYSVDNYNTTDWASLTKFIQFKSTFPKLTEFSTQTSLKYLFRKLPAPITTSTKTKTTNMQTKHRSEKRNKQKALHLQWKSIECKLTEIRLFFLWAHTLFGILVWIYP